MTDAGGTAEAVVVAYVHQNQVAYSWYHSMVELIGWDLAHDARVLRGGYIGMRYGSDGLVQARNKAVVHFLDEGKADWLFWIDTDMGFTADTVDRLLEAADPDERPIVGGLCFTQTETDEDGLGGWRCRATPTVFDWAKIGEQMGFAVRWDFPPDTLTQVAGTGGACILIHRTVFEKIEQAHGRVWYDRVPNTTSGQLLGEDLSFCLRAGALQIPMYVHTGVRTNHLKSTWVSDEDYWKQRALAAALEQQAPPATERTAVIVPVLNRPGNAAPFMESLKASGADLADVYAVCDIDDRETQDAWAAAGASTLVMTATFDNPGTFAEKVNIGYQNTEQPWLFLVGDDVQFEPGWLDHAQQAARDGFDVIGTNDLHNPRVTSGEHATHLLVRRSYVDEQGASWDGPKVVAHEGYRHWYVDDEIVTAAKQRETWAMAPHAHVEHLHPLWGLAADDDTYRLGQSHAEHDKALFTERLKANAP
jgi:hypothetical protein